MNKKDLILLAQDLLNKEPLPKDDIKMMATAELREWTLDCANLLTIGRDFIPNDNIVLETDITYVHKRLIDHPYEGEKYNIGNVTMFRESVRKVIVELIDVLNANSKD